MRIFPAIIIISGELTSNSAAINQAKTSWLEQQLQQQQLTFLPAQGVYKGQAERSFVVLTPRQEDIALVKQVANILGQEAVLISDSNRFTTLEFMSGEKSLPIGQLRQIPAAVAKGLDAYTIVDGEFYAAI